MQKNLTPNDMAKAYSEATQSVNCVSLKEKIDRLKAQGANEKRIKKLEAKYNNLCKHE